MRRTCLAVAAIATVLLLCGGVLSAAAADSWWLASTFNPLTGPQSMIFTFNDNVLSLNVHYLGSHTTRGSDDYAIHFSGDWAVCGFVDGGGALHRDPYATFVYNANRDGGYVQWSSDRPVGSGTNLLLGYSFTGNGSATYQGWHDDYMDQRTWLNPVSGTLVLEDHSASFYPFSYEDLSYAAIQHNFAVSEPSSILALISGLPGLLAMKKRRQH